MELKTTDWKKNKHRRLGITKKPKAKNPEQQIQAMCEQMLAIYDIPYFRLSDTLMRSLFANPNIPVHIKKILSEELKGFPDLLLFDKINYKYKPIEIKTEVGRLNHSQKKWQRNIGTKVVHGMDEAKKEIMEFVHKR